MKNLYFITPQFGRKNGGLGVSAERITRHLKDDYRIILFERDMELSAGTYQTQETFLGQGYRFSGNGESRQAAQFICDLLTHTFKTHSPDAFLCFYSGDLAFPSFMASRFLSKPLAIFGRGNDVDLDIFGPLGPQMINVWEKAEKVFCVSTEMELKVKAVAKKPRTIFIANSVDAEVFKPDLVLPVTSSRPQVGILGDIKTKKGLDFLLQYLPFEECDLQIIGNMRPESQKLLHGFLTLHPQFTKCIKLHSFITNPNELRKVYSDLDIVCIPSLHEGMPNVLLEAMAMEKIVVASNVGGNLDVIQDRENGFLFSPWDPASFGTTMREALKFLKDPAHLKIKAAARLTVEKIFNHKKEKKSYLKAIASLVTDRL